MNRLSVVFLSLSFSALAGPVFSQTFTPIGTIQGNASTATAGSFTVRGVVTAVYPNLSPAGFYLQNEAADADGNPATSDALFIVQANPTVAVGARLTVSGAVTETGGSPSNGQAVLSSPVITPLATGVALPAFALLDNATFSTAVAEPYEGMLIEFSAPVTVTDVGTIRSQGSLSISVRGLAFQPTQIIDPNDDPASGTSSTGATNVPAVNAYAAANTLKTLLLDDGRVTVNPNPTPYLDPALKTVRVGSTVARLRGIMNFSGGKWRVQPLAGADAPAVVTVRPAVPTFAAPVDVRVASFNIENFFNGDGAGGGFPTSRGANTYADYRRQRAKIIVAITQLNPDVAGLIEVENDGTRPTSALVDLVNGLNGAAGAGTYAFVNDGGVFSQPGTSDLIHCAIIYKPAVVRPIGPALIAAAPNTFERVPLAQVFSTVRPGGAPADTFALVVNHFKAKSSGTGANADQGDGQGASNLRRKQQAAALVQFINSSVIPAGNARVITVGDYNANYEEDPLDIMRAAGFVLGSPPSSTSYVFNGLSSSLDHAILSPALAARAEVHKWNINGAEPDWVDYAIAGAATDTTIAFRTSDHDPILIGLNLRRPLATKAAAAGAALGLEVFPNPAARGFGFRLKDGAGPVSVEVLTALGQRVLVLNGGASAVSADLSHRSAALPAGVYALRVSAASGSAVQRVVKE